MNPKIWGPPAWLFLYSIILNYPDNPTNKDKQNIYNFFMSLGNVLPCEKCSKNYENHILKYPINNNILNNKYSLFNWLNTINNQVQISLNKKQYTSKERLEYIKNIYKPTSYSKYIIISIIIIGLLLFIVKYLI